MIKTETLDTLFDLLREMSLERRKLDEIKQNTRFRRLAILMGCSYALATLTLVAVLLASRWLPSPTLVVVSIFSASGSIVFGSAYILFALLDLAWDFQQMRKKPFENLFARLRVDLPADARYLARLAAYDKATLEYALLQLRHRWDVADSRMNLVIGDLRKLGMLPAFAASATSASMLLKNDSSLWLWLPLLVLTSLYLLLLPLHANRERPQQVVELLRYAIEHATVSPATATVTDIATSAAVETTEAVLTAVSPAPPPTAATRPATALPAAPLPSTI